MRATLAARTGDMAEAVSETRRALEIVPDSAELHVEAAEVLLWAGRRSEAEKLAGRALELETDHPGALRFLADLAATRALGTNPDESAARDAIARYARIAELEGSEVDPQVLQVLSQLHIQTRDVPGAIEWVGRLVERRPGDLVANRTLAQLLLQQGERDRALRVLLRFLAEHPHEEDLLGFAEQLGRSLDAWALIDEELSAHPPTGEEGSAMLRFLAEARLRLGRVEGAVEVLERALSTDPDHPWIRFRLAQGYRALGRTADAVELLRELVVEQSDSADFQFELAQALERQRDVEGALGAYLAALAELEDERHQGARESIRRRLAALYLAEGDVAGAAAVLERLEEPEHVEALELRARVALSGEDDAALRHTLRRLRSMGQAGLAALLEGEALAAEGRFSRAEQRFAESVEALGPAVRRRIAGIWLTHDRVAEATAVLEEWVRQEPEDADVRFYLGDLLYQADDFSAAEQHLREAFRLDPTHGESLNYLGYSLAERNERLDEALHLVERALETDTWNGAYLDSLGWVYYRMGRYDDAVQALERAAREMPKDPTILEHLGDAYLGADQRDKALSAWNRALEAEPDDPEELRSKIGRLSSRSGEPRQGAVATTDGPGGDRRLVDPAPPAPRPR